MSLVVPDVGKTRLLDKLLTAYGTSMKAGLYVYNHDPVEGDLISDYNGIHEASFPSYVRQNITGWTPSVLSSGRALSAADLMTWTVLITSGTDIVYGYFVVDSTGNLLWAELNPLGPIPMNDGGQSLSLMPRFTQNSEF